MKPLNDNQPRLSSLHMSQARNHWQKLLETMMDLDEMDQERMYGFMATELNCCSRTYKSVRRTS